MNTLKRLWQSVQAFGYPLRSLSDLVPPTSRNHSSRNRYRTAVIEEMEPRLLLTTITSGDNPFTYIDSAGTKCTVSIKNGTAELIFINSARQLCNYVAPTVTAADDKGMDLFAVLITSSDSTTVFTVDGIYPDTNGPAGSLYGATPSLWAGVTNSTLYPIASPGNGGVVYIGSRIQGTPVSNVPEITVSDTSFSTNAGEILNANAHTALADAKAVLNGLSSSTYSNSVFTAGVYVLPDHTTGVTHDMGKVLIDGTVTGNVYVSGSIDTFYCGWLLTGDAADQTSKVDNFYVAGDISHLMVQTSVGFGAKANTTSVPISGVPPYYSSQVDIHVGGQIGNIKVGGVFLATTTVDNKSDAPSFSAGYTQSDPDISLSVNNLNNQAGAFRSGLLPIIGGNSLSNSSATNPDYLGVVDSGRDAIVSGSLNTLQAANNANDYYAVGLIAGQSITLNFDDTFLVGSVLMDQNLVWGIIDSENRVVAISHGKGSLTFKATEPGIYRIAVGLTGDFTLNGSVGLKTSATYTLTARNLGNANTGMAIGGIKAGGDIVFAPNTGLVVTRGDVGIISSNGTIYGGHDSTSINIGGNSASFSASLPPSITVANGNIAAVYGSSIGMLDALRNVEFGLGMLVDGTVGVIGATGTHMTTGVDTDLLGAYVVASGDIQVIDGKSEVGGKYASKESIGVIRAGQMTLGTAETQFSADYDNSGRDGIIDLIDVKGDLGANGPGGPRITTGTGGNIRFIHISDSSSIYQDNAWNTWAADDRGGITYTGGESIPTFTDDSGAQITLAPQGGSTDPATKIMTVWTYAIFGTGGVVVVRVESNYSLNVSVTSGNQNPNQSAEIGQIVLNGVGSELVPTGPNGTYTNPASTTTTTSTNSAGQPTIITVINPFNNLAIGGSFRLDVFEVSSSHVINNITNTTAGDIVNINGGNIGTISVNGSLGVTSSATGTALNQIDVINNSFPFINLHNGLIANNIGTISAGKAIGAIHTTGSVGSIVANADDINDSTIFEGIVAPIVIGDSTAGGNLNFVDIGEGMAADSVSSYPTGGIYVGGTLYSLVGSYADIRSNIITRTGIGSINLSNGSIVGAFISVLTDFSMAWKFNSHYIFNNIGGGTVSNPQYEIKNISITGNGGIIGTRIWAADIGVISVADSGFGIVDCNISTLANGVVNSIVAGGWGLVGTLITTYRIGSLRATGTGAALDLSQYSNSVRLSQQYSINPYTGQSIADENPNTIGYYTDLNLYLTQGATVNPYESDPDHDVYGSYTAYFSHFGRSPYTGMILNCDIETQIIGTVTTYGLEATRLLAPNSVGTINVTRDAVFNFVLAGSISKVNIGGDAISMDLEAAGKIGTVTIDGKFDAASLIYAKGPSSSADTINIKGDFIGKLTAAGKVSNLNIGTAPTKTTAGSGLFKGTVKLLGDVAAGNVNFYGTVGNGSNIVINGSITGALNFAAGLGGALTINGKVGTIKVGTDPLAATSGVSANITIAGDLDNLIVRGALKSGAVLNVQGDLGTLTLNGADTDIKLLDGSVIVGGKITAINLNGSANTSTGGSLTGYIQAVKNIGTITVNNGDIADTAIIRSLMAGIAKISVVNGIVNGTIQAGSVDLVTPPTAGVIGTIELKAPAKGAVVRTGYGSIGAKAEIYAASMGTLTVPGNIASNAFISVAGAIATLTVTGNIQDAASLSFAKVTKSFTVTGNMLGDLAFTEAAYTNSLKINGDFGSAGSTASITTAGSLKLALSGKGTIFAGTSVLRVGGNLVTLDMKTTDLNGTIIVDGTISSLTAASMTGAVVTAGANIDKVAITGDVKNSLIQAGITAGADNIFGNGADETTGMGSIGTITFGQAATKTLPASVVSNSVIAAGGSIKSFTAKGVMDNSSVSSGLVYTAGNIQTVINDALDPLNGAGEVNALRKGGTLYHGNFDTVSVNGGKADGLINGSAITAGISAGADGIFKAADDTTDAPGTSAFKSVKALAHDSSSVILAETASPKSVNGLDNVGVGTHLLTPAGVEVLPTSHVGNKYVFTVNGKSVTITVSTGVTVRLYDDAATAGVVDSLVISSTSAVAGSVTIVADDPSSFKLGQVLAGDDVNLGTFTFNGDIVGLAGKASVQIDSAMKAFTVRNFTTYADSSIGGDVGTMTIADLGGVLGGGQLTVGGAVKVLKITTSSAVYSAANNFGLVANSFGTVTLGLVTSTTPFTGRLKATLGGTVNSIASVTINGTGAFVGAIAAAGSVGTITVAKANFDGILTAGGDVSKVTISVGKYDAGSKINVDGTLGTLSVKSDFGGHLTANNLGTLTVGGTMVSGSVVTVTNSVGSLNVAGTMTGTVNAGAAGTLSIGGVVTAASSIRIAGDVQKLYLNGGTATSSLVLVDGSITTLSVGGTHAGTIATNIGGNVTNASFVNVNNGLLVVAGDIGTLRATGTVTDSLFSAGVYIGASGKYNDDDDVVYGGSIGTASFTGEYVNSVIAAGVLPKERLDLSSQPITGLPDDRRDYTGNTDSSAAADDVDPAQTGGLTRSTIGTVSFSKRLLQTSAKRFSAVVAADAINKVSYKGSLTSRVIGNPNVELEAVSAKAVDTNKIEVIFSQPLDTATLNTNTIEVLNNANVPYTISSITYSVKQPTDDSRDFDYVVTITTSTTLAGTTLTRDKVSLTGGTSGDVISNHVSVTRSAKVLDLDNTPGPDYQPFVSVDVPIVPAA